MRARVAVAAAATLLGFASGAWANGRFPKTNQLVVMQTNPSVVVVRSTFGVLFSKDRGQNWDWVCEQGIGYGGVEDPAIGITSSGTVLLAAFEGLAVSPDTGCSWSTIGGPLAKQFFVDVAVRPDNPHAAVAIASTYDGDGGAQSFYSQIFETTDDGAHWTAYGDPLDPTFVVATVDVSATDPHRVYVSATKTASTRTAAIFVSKTDGTQWTSTNIPLVSAAETSVFIAAVDPKNADVVYVRTGDETGTQPSRLLVSSDGAQTFTQRYAGGPMLGFALAPDGSKVYLGGPTDGLEIAKATDLAFTRRSTLQVGCLATSGSTLYACSSDVSGFIVGASTDDGATFAPLLHLCSVRGPLACGAGTAAAVCPASWPNVASQISDPCVSPDGGPPPGADGGADAGPGVPASGKSGGCAAAPGAVGAGGGALVTLGIAVALLGRKRRKRP